MEVRHTLARWWGAFANALGGFLDQTAFRLSLVFDVIVGRLPREVERRSWNRSVEAPILVDVCDWTDGRRIASVLVWPPLESSTETALGDHRARAAQGKEVIARGAAELAYSTQLETDYGLGWDHERQVWTTRDGFAYDEQRPRDAA